MKVKEPTPLRLTQGSNPGRVASENTQLVYDDIKKKLVRVRRIRY